jgi:hypothetical protein
MRSSFPFALGGARGWPAPLLVFLLFSFWVFLSLYTPADVTIHYLDGYLLGVVGPGLPPRRFAPPLPGGEFFGAVGRPGRSPLRFGELGLPGRSPLRFWVIRSGLGVFWVLWGFVMLFPVLASNIFE